MSLNGFSSNLIADRIQEAPYRFLVCADKFQAGYDEPLLHTMFADKLLDYKDDRIRLVAKVREVCNELDYNYSDPSDRASSRCRKQLDNMLVLASIS